MKEIPHPEGEFHKESERKREKWEEEFEFMDKGGFAHLFFTKRQAWLQRTLEDKGLESFVYRSEDSVFIFCKYTGEPVKYTGVFSISRRMPIEVHPIEIKQLKKDGRIVTIYGDVGIELAKIDEERSLKLTSHISYGEFIVIEDKNYPSWKGHKFDLEIKHLGKEYLSNKELYEFIGRLIQLSQECEIGLTVKPVGTYFDEKNKVHRVFLSSSGVHLYPYFEKYPDSKKVKEKLLRIYQRGKEWWGDAFHVAEHNRGAFKRDGVFF